MTGGDGHDGPAHRHVGGDAILEEAAVHDFAADLRGPLLRPGDGGYDEARNVWNGMIDRRPALIARCAGVADVIAAVRFRPRPRAAGIGPRRRSQHHRQRRLRGRADDRPVADEERPGRSGRGARRAPRPGSPGASTTARRRLLASPAPAGSSRRPASPG